MDRYQLIVDVTDRVDRYISQKLSILSRAKVKKLVELGMVLVNGREVEPSFQVKIGDKIIVQVPPEEEVKLEPENLPLKIVYEDQDCLVIEKDAGTVVHPAVGHQKGTLVNALLFYLKKKSTKDARAGIVHRLDKETSGLMVVAKNEEAEKSLKNQFKNRVVKKAYLCLVQGILAKKEGVIGQPIGRHPKNRQKFAVVETGRPSQTEYEVKEEIGKYSLVEARPLTGRTHQIRVHFSSLGHPLVGDSLYGGKKLLRPELTLNRQFLHASYLGFKQPTTGAFLEFYSDLPESLLKLLKILRSLK